MRLNLGKKQPGIITAFSRVASVSWKENRITEMRAAA
jgi:hypothetical protein